MSLSFSHLRPNATKEQSFGLIPRRNAKPNGRLPCQPASVAGGLESWLVCTKLPVQILQPTGTAAMHQARHRPHVRSSLWAALSLSKTKWQKKKKSLLERSMIGWKVLGYRPGSICRDIKSDLSNSESARVRDKNRNNSFNNLKWSRT